ncbi:MAG: hypothetical protein KBS67_06130 [Bacteroidales bacterium]|nr:hypothetical protein [Candidatus Cryptobacteroides equifaecalis]
MKKRIMVYAGIVLAFLVLSYAFVPQVLGGKIVNQSDISGWQGMSHEMMEWNAAHPSDQTAWTGSMFSGMPTTTIHASTKGDWTQYLYDLLLTGRRPATYLFISLLGAFLLMLAFGINPLIAAFGAVAVSFCSYNMQIIQVGHNTKMQAIAFMPWVLAALVYTYRKASEERKWLPLTVLGAAGFGLFLSFQVKANHPQITYYLALMIFIYALVQLIWMLVDPERRRLIGRFFAASALLLVLGLAGIGTNAIKLLPTYEYTPYSMRGGSTASADGSKQNKGLDLNYATAWSYGFEELPNLLIPNYNGGSSAGAVNPKNSETYALLKKAGQPNLKEVSKHLPLYWGPQPFTAGPMYMGAVTIFLFIFSLCFYRGKERWWVVAVTLLAVLLGLGSHLMWFTRFFYDYVPFYNKFRTVSMSLTVLQVALPVLGFLMLDSIVKSGESRENLKREVLIAGGISAGICLLLAVVMSLRGSFTGAVDEGQSEVLVEALAADRYHLLWADTWRSLILILCSAGILFWGISADSGKGGRRAIAAILVGAIVLVDLFSLDRRYLNSEHFVTKNKFQSQFSKRPVDEMILEDTDPSYRVLDLSVNVFNDSHPSYWHKNIGGYSPAKLQRYQEFIDRRLTKEINEIYKSISEVKTIQEAEDSIPYLPGLAELNCRYIILGADLPPVTYRHARGNAWFEEECEDSIELSSYAPNELRYRYSASQPRRAVFSEVYYPAGWTLRMEDGSELEIGVYDDILRSAVLPAGDHELVMRFEPVSYSRGEAISRACSIALLLLVLLSVFFAIYNKK